MKRIFLLILSLILISCGDNIPSGSDSDVKDLVLNICTEEIQNQLVQSAIMTELGMSPRMWNNPTYAELKKLNDENAKKVIDKVDKQLEDVDMELDAIRTLSIDEKIGKITCSAELRFSNGNKLDIQYTAQYTDDGKLYVSVYGLR